MNRTSSVLSEISLYSWLVTIALDLLWTPLEGLVSLSLVGLIVVPLLMILLFGLCAFSVTLIQRYSVQEEWGAAIGKGILLGIVAAVPFPVFTTALAILSTPYRRRARLDREAVQLGQLTQAWRDMEGLLRNALPYPLPNERIDQVIERLYEGGQLSASERDELHRLRQRRNAVVHEGASDDLSDLVERIQNLYGQLAWRLG